MQYLFLYISGNNNIMIYRKTQFFFVLRNNGRSFRLKPINRNDVHRHAHCLYHCCCMCINPQVKKLIEFILISKYLYYLFVIVLCHVLIVSSCVIYVRYENQEDTNTTDLNEEDDK